MSTTAQNEARVKRGMEWLDKKRGEKDWACGIDLEDLQISSYSYCILGQLYDGFGDGCEKLKIQDFGSFTVSLGFMIGEEDYNWNPLNDEWKKQLTERCK